ncbi:hypothetical protein E4U17_006244, partial [Claviceps sp. LM77 group G4]
MDQPEKASNALRLDYRPAAGSLDSSDLEQLADPDAGLSEAQRKEVERKLLWKLDLAVTRSCTYRGRTHTPRPGDIAPRDG